MDNGTEFTSKALDDWAYKRGVKLITMHGVHEKLKAWQHDYNHHRPHGSLGHLTPSEFATMRSEQPKQAANL